MLFVLGSDFYTFDFGMKSNLWIFMPLVFCTFKILKKFYFFFPLFVCILDFLILFSFEGLFSLWLCIFLNIALILAIFDNRYFVVPTWLNFLLLIIAVFKFYFSNDLQEILESLYEAFALIGFLSFLQVSMRAILNKEVLGDGDIVFVFSLGLVFGLMQSFFILFLGSIVGIFIACCRKKRKYLPMITLLTIGIFLDFLLGFFNV